MAAAVSTGIEGKISRGKGEKEGARDGDETAESSARKAM